MEKRVLVYGMTGVRGGVESYIMNFLRRFDRSRVMFDFVVSDETMACEQEARDLDCEIYHVPKITASPLGHIRAFYRLLKAHPEYETVYYNINSAFSCVAMVAGAFAGRRRVAHSHNGFVESRRLLHMVFRPVLNLLSNQRLACSDKAAVFMFGSHAYHSGNVRIIHNAIETQRFCFSSQVRDDVRAQLNVPDGQMVVGHVGRFCPQKNHGKLLEIFQTLHVQNPRTELWLIGEGEGEQAVRTLVAEKHLEGAVRFLGVRKDVERLMQGMDVFLLPSLFEGLPIVGVEAQAAGLPCVFADTVTAQADITGNVQFVPLAADSQTWVQAVMRTKTADRSACAQQVAQAGYSIEQEAGRLQELLAATGGKEMLRIEEVRAQELKICKAFADFCEDNGLRYYMCGGTLLGAVRHKGFIPWDDDMDLLMPRPDYDRFVSLANGHINGYNVDTREGTKGYYYPFCKVTNPNIKVKPSNVDQEADLWIDIFPMDGAPADPAECDAYLEKMRTKHHFFMYTMAAFRNVKLRTLPKYLFTLPFRPFKKQLSRWVEKCGRAVDFDSHPYVAVSTWGYGKRERMEKEAFLPQIEMEFDGIPLKTTADYETYLRKIYGDYMQLPPENERTLHFFGAWRVKGGH